MYALVTFTVPVTVTFVYVMFCGKHAVETLDVQTAATLPSRHDDEIDPIGHVVVPNGSVAVATSNVAINRLVFRPIVTLFPETIVFAPPVTLKLPYGTDVIPLIVEIWATAVDKTSKNNIFECSSTYTFYLISRID